MYNPGHSRTIVALAASSMLVAIGLLASCAPPGDPEQPNLETEDGIGGAETGVDEDDFVTDGNCLVGAVGGAKGYRHHCGGDLSFVVEGQYHDSAGWHPTDDFGMTVGFGPTYASSWLEDDDVYATPFVAACCGGPYDFENIDTNYTNNYALNCALDAVQQLCASLPRYYKAKGDAAAAVIQQRYYAIAEYLNDSDVQGSCVLSLYEEDDPGHLIQNRSWQIIDNADADYTISVGLLEILEWDYPDNPNDVAECSSIYDNDDSVIPLVEQLAGYVEGYTIASGNGQLTNDDDVAQAMDPDLGSVLSTVVDPGSGELELRNLVLKGGGATIVVKSMPYVVDRWSLRLVTPVVTPPFGGMHTFRPGSMTLVANVFADGDAISLTGTNAGTVSVFAGPRGWVIRGLEVEYDDNGTLWTYSQTSDLEFD